MMHDLRINKNITTKSVLKKGDKQINRQQQLCKDKRKRNTRTTIT